MENHRSHCPINLTLEVFGDKWSLLIISHIMIEGKRHFRELLHCEEKIASNILALRLEHLINEGVLQKTKDPADRRKDFYTLTEKGLDLIPLLLELVSWSERYDAGSEARKQGTFVARIRKDREKLTSEIKKSVRGGGSVFGAPRCG